MTKKTFYLDTNILRDIVANRNRNSVIFFELAKIANVQLTSSIYAVMEFIDIRKDEMFFEDKVNVRGWDISRFLRERYKKQFLSHDIQKLDEYHSHIAKIMEEGNLSFLDLVSDGWMLAMQICVHSCLTSDDSLHLATLLSAQCDYLVTNDSDFIKEAKALIAQTDQSAIECCTSDRALEIVREIIKSSPQNHPQ